MIRLLVVTGVFKMIF
ncbi:hypothetical protein [Salmonella enterica]|nr:hypothetical protein [Salmonella enterica]